MKILSLDTSTQACSVALYVDGQTIEKHEVCPQKHTKKILGLIDALLAESKLKLSQIDAIAYGKGPGSFAGVRLAISVAQGLGFSSNRPLVPISSLAAMGLYALKQCSQIDTVVTALDARMNQVYLGAYQVHNKTIMPVMDEILVDWQSPSLPHDVSTNNIIGCGHGFTVYPLAQGFNFEFKSILGEVLPHAGEIGCLAVPMLESNLASNAADCYASYLRQDIAQS